MKAKKFMAFALLSWIVFAACLISSILGITTEHYNGIAVDSRNYLYIGCYNDIRVYFNGENLYDIVAKSTPSGSYNFSISNDEIAIYKNQKVYYYTLDGSFVRTENDEKMRQSLYAYQNRNECSSNGKKYLLKSRFGREYIIRIDEKAVETIVFQMPLLDWIVKVCQPISIIAFMVFVVLFFKNSKFFKERFHIA